MGEYARQAAAAQRRSLIRWRRAAGTRCKAAGAFAVACCAGCSPSGAIPKDLFDEVLARNPYAADSKEARAQLHISDDEASYIRATLGSASVAGRDWSVGDRAPEARIPLTTEERTIGEEQANAVAAERIYNSLTGPQRDVVMRIALKSLGPESFGVPALQSYLGMGPDQRSKVRSIVFDYKIRMASLAAQTRLPGAPNSQDSPKARLPDQQQLTRSQAENQVNRILTDAQRQKWEAMVGPRG